jgi:hypothetical protein
MTVLVSPLNCAVAIAVSIALAAATGHAAEESTSEDIAPWKIEAIYKGDKLERCSIDRSLEHEIVVRFVRTLDGLSLELESPNWKLERGKDYPVKMAMGSLSFDTEVAAEANSVSMEIKEKKFESGLRNASALNVVAAGATIVVPLDKSTAAFDRLEQCVVKNDQRIATYPFCGSATSAVVAGVGEGKGPDCSEERGAPTETKSAEDSESAEEIKPLRRVKSRTLRSRPVPSFLADLFIPRRR